MQGLLVRLTLRGNECITCLCMPVVDPSHLQEILHGSRSFGEIWKQFLQSFLLLFSDVKSNLTWHESEEHQTNNVSGEYPNVRISLVVSKNWGEDTL